MSRILSTTAIVVLILTGSLRGRAEDFQEFSIPRYACGPIQTQPSPRTMLPDLGLVPISSSRHPGHLYDIAYRNGLLALANGWQRYSGNFILFDAGDADTIKYISSYSLNVDGGAIRVAMANEIALLSVVGQGLIVLDISNPEEIEYSGGLSTVPSINEIVIAGNKAYLPIMDTGLAIVDISNPASPHLVGSYRSGRPSFSAAVNGDHAYIADGIEGLSVYDIHDPANPVLVGTVPEGDDLLLSVTSRGNILAAIYRSAMINSGGIILYDITNPSSPVKVGERSIFGVEVFPAVDIEIKGDYLLFAAGQTGFHIYDISDPTSPEMLGGCGGGVPPNGQFVSWPSRIAMGQSNVYTTCPDWFYVPSENEIQVLDVSDPYNPGIVSTWDTPAAVRNSVVVDNVAYLAASHDGLVVQDITDPYNPFFLSRVCSAGEEGFITGTALEVRDGIAYIVGGGQSLTTIDVVDPGEPVILGSYDEGGYASDIVTSSGYSLITHYEIFPENGWVSVVDVGDPWFPIRTGRYYTGSLTFGLDWQNSYAYLACRDGIQVVDVSDPDNPIGAGFAITGAGCYDAVKAGYYVYAVDEQTGLNVIDVSDPFHPVVVAVLRTPGVSKDIAIEGNRAYIADFDGILTVDISDPGSPFVLGWKRTWGNATGISATTDNVFLSDTFGWDIFGIVPVN